MFREQGTGNREQGTGKEMGKCGKCGECGAGARGVWEVWGDGEMIALPVA
ncbi:MAG: hypothetical protein F6K56_21565 [Moorea sp. SIO3G5]|nr:hypothetical protein [Moorena sp. SIO3G5]